MARKPVAQRLTDVEARLTKLEKDLGKSLKDGDFVTIQKTCSLRIAKKLSEAADLISKLGKK
jgi:hypothetical protein